MRIRLHTSCNAKAAEVLLHSLHSYIVDTIKNNVDNKTVPNINILYTSVYTVVMRSVSYSVAVAVKKYVQI